MEETLMSALNINEELMKKIDDEGLGYINCEFPANPLKGLYVDGYVLCNEKRIESIQEHNCILAEELTHYEYTVGDCLDYKNPNNWKEEVRIRNRSFKYLITLDKVIDAFESGCDTTYDFLEYLGVTEEYFCNWLNYMQSLYGDTKLHNGYLIYFSSFWIEKV